MKQLIGIVILCILLANCKTASNYSSIVDTKTQTVHSKVDTSKNWLIVNSDLAEPNKNIFDQKKNSFIPAILYWEWNSTIECELGIDTRLEYIKEGIYKASDSLNLEQYLSGKTLEINLNEIPGKFLYEYKGNTIILIIAYTVSAIEAIHPYPINLEFEYAVRNGGNKEMEGNGYIQNGEQPMQNVWKSSKKFTWTYLDQFQREMERMGTELVSEIIKELKRRDS